MSTIHSDRSIADSPLSNGDLAPTEASYGSLLAAFAGVMIVDSWILRKTVLDVVELYRERGRYWYSRGYNVRALVAVAIGVIPVIPGFLHGATTKGGVVADPSFLDELYRYGVFVAFGLAAVSYFLMARSASREATAPAMAE